MKKWKDVFSSHQNRSSTNQGHELHISTWLSCSKNGSEWKCNVYVFMPYFYDLVHFPTPCHCFFYMGFYM